MRSTVKITTFLLLVAMVLFCTLSCDKKTDTAELWKNATYRSDTTIGNGANTVRVKVTAGEQSVTLTVKTDKATLGEALYERQLVNDPSFFDTCNGIKADWNRDRAYWTFYVGDESAPYGIGDTRAATVGEPTYQIIYTK